MMLKSAVCILLLAAKALAAQSTDYAWNEYDVMPVPRADLAVVTLGENIYVIGGSPGSGGGSNESLILGLVQIYNPMSRTWTEGPPLLVPRYRHCACLLNGDIWVIGGRTTGDLCLDSVEVLRSGATAWAFAEPLLLARSDHGCFAYAESVYAAGGYDQNYTSALADVERWSAASPLPTAAPPLLFARGDLACTTLKEYDTYAYCVGGFGVDWLLVQNSVERFDGTQWVLAAPLAHPRADMAFSHLDDFLLGTGGEDWVDNADVAVRDSELYNPLGDVWEDHLPMPEGARFRVATTTLKLSAGDAVFVFGGHDSDMHPVDHIEVFSSPQVFAELPVVQTHESSEGRKCAILFFA